MVLLFFPFNRLLIALASKILCIIHVYVKGVVSLSYQIFKGKYLAKDEFSTGETLTYDAKCISLYSLLGYILFHCYYTAVACKNSHGISIAYKFSMAYSSRTPKYRAWYLLITNQKNILGFFFSKIS